MIVRPLAVALASFFVLASPARAADPPPAYGALFDEVWKTVGTNFYDPTFNGRDWRALGDRYRAEASAAPDDAAFGRVANRMLNELGVSHLHLSPPAANAVRGGVGIGAEIETIDGARVVIEVAPLSDAQRQGLRVGDRIVGPKSLAGPLGGAVDVEVMGCDGEVRRMRIRREQASWPPPHPGLSWRILGLRPGLKVGYLRIDRFDDGAAELADRAMDALAETQGIIIDIRRNGGGNLSALRLASYFSGESRPAVALLARPYLDSLGRRATAADLANLAPTQGAYTDAAVFAAVERGRGAAVYQSEDMGAKRYKGAVVVVMSGETASAGEGFALIMRDLAAAPLVGRPTAGQLLSSDRFSLSGGWRLTVPVGGVWGVDGRDFGDRSVTPDVEVPRAAADVCRARDADLDRALEVLESRLGR
ncbi:S41 family peptidase [Phenylobacterium sp.]|uniref:S41 family peptidase n=1 Tax=Phenylobacterium sp. TaxID=1871053 RepID=UPI00301C8784